MSLLRAVHELIFGSSGDMALVMIGHLVMLCTLTSVACFILWRLPRKPRVIILSLAGLIIAGLVVHSYVLREYWPRPLAFDGDSTKLSRTCVVPTLDTPIEPGKNIIWCASFQAAWKSLQNDVVKEPVQLTGGADVCARLNESPMPEALDGTLYAAAGCVRDGIVDTIRRELARRFPRSPRPSFPNVTADDLVAYGYLESSFKFSFPYADCVGALGFTDSAGKTTPVRAFGIQWEADPMFSSVRKQVGVLVRLGAVKERPDDFVLDLCRDSKDTQIVIACVPVGRSLRETLAAVDTDIASAQSLNGLQGSLNGEEPVLIPELAYRVMHDFPGLAGRSLTNETFKRKRLAVAQQSLMFRLDRSGAEPRIRKPFFSSHDLILYRPTRRMFGDRPFLLYFKKRGAALPYFAMWVDNDELLMKRPGKAMVKNW